MLIGLGPLLLMALIGGVVYAASRHHHHAAPVGPVRRHDRPSGGSGELRAHRRTSSPAVPHSAPMGSLDDSLSAWTGAGLITTEQAAAIRGFEQTVAMTTAPASATTARPRRVPLVAEALGYLGGILAIVGVVLLVARYWTDMAGLGRLALSGGVAAALVVAGGLLGQSEPALVRLRAVLWFGAAVATGLFAGVAVTEAVDDPAATTVALVVAAAVALLDAALWSWRVQPVQQALTLIGVATAAGVGTSMLAAEGPTGLVLLALGLAGLAAGWRSLTPTPAVTVLVGAASAVVGSAVSASGWQGPGLVLSMLVVLGMLVLVTSLSGPTDTASRTALLVVAIVGLASTGPGSVVYFAEDAAIVTGLTMCLLGAAMVTAGGLRRVRVPLLVQTVGGLVVVGGAAVTAVESTALATLLGLVLAIGMIALGTVPGQVMLSLAGSVGLLVNVPWAIVHFFPGEGRAPLLILTCGAVIVAVAVWLARQGGRFRSELRR